MKKIFIILLAALSTGLFSDAKKICVDYDKQPDRIKTENTTNPDKCGAAPDTFDFSPMNFFLFI